MTTVTEPREIDHDRMDRLDRLDKLVDGLVARSLDRGQIVSTGRSDGRGKPFQFEPPQPLVKCLRICSGDPTIVVDME